MEDKICLWHIDYSDEDPLQFVHVTQCGKQYDEITVVEAIYCPNCGNKIVDQDE